TAAVGQVGLEIDAGVRAARARGRAGAGASGPALLARPAAGALTMTARAGGARAAPCPAGAAIVRAGIQVLATRGAWRLSRAARARPGDARRAGAAEASFVDEAVAVVVLAIAGLWARQRTLAQLSGARDHAAAPGRGTVARAGAGPSAAARREAERARAIGV